LHGDIQRLAELGLGLIGLERLGGPVTLVAEPSTPRKGEM
jgi:hypothetical protein